MILKASVRGLSTSPRQLVAQQLGYVPKNFLQIEAFTQNGEALVIKSYPVDGGSPKKKKRIAIGTPFPTLFWLCHADISRAVADLERRGYVSRLSDVIATSPDLRTELDESHVSYAKLRWESIKDEDKKDLPQNFLPMLRDSGIAGAALDKSKPPSIKCLHAHYAHYRATMLNPVGRLVHELLCEEFPDLVL